METFFIDIVEKHMLTTEFKLKANKIPYIDPEAKQMIRQRDYLRAKANRMGSNILRQAYSHIRNKVNSTLRKLRKYYYTNRIEINEGNLKNTWKIWKEAIGLDRMIRLVVWIRFLLMTLIKQIRLK